MQRNLSSQALSNKPAFQRILTSQYPFLLIDESQDTNKELIDALLLIQPLYCTRFSLGLLGDTMQRIYADGKANIEQSLPHDWVKPAKRLNHRCPGRIVELINKIRSAVDDHQQVSRSDKEEGCVRFFVLPSDTADKPSAERKIADNMAQITSDPAWKEPAQCKTLILEHHMAARRMQFLDLFTSLYQVEEFRTGLLNGSLPLIRFFAGQILPLIKAHESADQFAIAKIARDLSPLLSVPTLKTSSNQRLQLTIAKDAIHSLMSLWSQVKTPCFKDVLENIAKSNLFSIPDSLIPFAGLHSSNSTGDETFAVEQVDNPSLRATAIEEFLSTPFSQIEPYALYVSGNSPYATHQGVKGLEFPRVMVVMDDAEARGFMFSYEKLLGAEIAKTRNSRQPSASGETAIDRTRRLFYVTCSRTKKSLAIVAYSSSPSAVKAQLLNAGWCNNREMQVGY